jgi:Uma2 family endonuclease
MSAVLETLPKNFTKVPNDVVERVILHGISWETYERILSEHIEVSDRHFSYCDGDLEIMVLGYKHEKFKHLLSELVVEIARILELDYEGAASTTFRKESKKKGFEGDATFYFENAGIIRGKNEIDLTTDPSPELVVEIDITHGSMPKFPIFADLGIQEVWRFDAEKVSFYRLEKNGYKEVQESICLPKVQNQTVTNLLYSASEMKRIEWIKLIYEAVKKD